jgi:SAM-dependent methyltransferase
MPVTQAQLYMPRAEGTFRGNAENLFRRLQYSLWGREIRRFVADHPASRLRIVDVGCGPGFLLRCFARWFHGAELIGVDQSAALLEIAQSRCEGMKPLLGDACALPLADGSADVAFALHVVEHLAQPGEFFAEARRVVRPGGLLVIATPNAASLGARIMGRKWIGFSDPTHISLHRSSYWSEMLDRSGFEIARQGTTGLSGIPLLNKMPLGLIHWIPSFLFGYFPWKLGEAYICVATRRPEEEAHANRG